ncbi:MAG: hypothetical protein AAFP86_11225, partial [Planctomycetota bacterium]
RQDHDRGSITYNHDRHIESIGIRFIAVLREQAERTIVCLDRRISADETRRLHDCVRGYREHGILQGLESPPERADPLPPVDPPETESAPPFVPTPG